MTDDAKPQAVQPIQADVEALSYGIARIADCIEADKHPFWKERSDAIRRAAKVLRAASCALPRPWKITGEQLFNQLSPWITAHPKDHAQSWGEYYIGAAVACGIVHPTLSPIREDEAPRTL